MLEILNLFLKNIGLSFAGLLGYGFIIYGIRLSKNKPKEFWKQHKHFALWAIGFQVLYSFVLAFFPVIEIWIAKRMIAVASAVLQIEINIPEENMVTVVYLMGGFLLSVLANKRAKKEKGVQNA